ncbi:MAG: hypothetical protein AABY22_36765, partial [Nanoarchaeota archaeon]
NNYNDILNLINSDDFSSIIPLFAICNIDKAKLKVDTTKFGYHCSLSFFDNYDCSFCFLACKVKDPIKNKNYIIVNYLVFFYDKSEIHPIIDIKIFEEHEKEAILDYVRRNQSSIEFNRRAIILFDGNAMTKDTYNNIIQKWEKDLVEY